jgi:hypothetical protein
MAAKYIPVSVAKLGYSTDHGHRKSKYKHRVLNNPFQLQIGYRLVPGVIQFTQYLITIKNVHMM